MFKKNESLIRKFLAVTSLCVMHDLCAAKFSVDNDLQSGPSSLHDVIKSANAISPGSGSHNTIFFRQSLIFSHTFPILRQPVELSVLEGSPITFKIPLKSSAPIIKNGPSDLVLEEGLECLKLVVDQGTCKLLKGISQSFPIDVRSELWTKEPRYVSSNSILLDKGKLTIAEGGAFLNSLEVNQEGTLHVDKETLSLANLKGSGLFHKSGQGLLEITKPLTFSGSINIDEGQVILKSRLFETGGSLKVTNLVTVDKPEFMNADKLELQSGACLRFLNGGRSESLVHIEDKAFFDTVFGKTELSLCEGSGDLTKQGYGSLVVDKLASSEMRVVVKQGSFGLNHSHFKGKISLEGGDLSIGSEKKYHTYCLSVKKGALDLKSPKAFFTEAIDLHGSDFKIALNQNHLQLRSGFKGWGMVEIEGPGEIEIYQKDSVCADVKLRNLALKTSYFADDSIYHFHDVTVYAETALNIAHQTTLDIASGTTLFQAQTQPIDIQGALDGQGVLIIESQSRSTLAPGRRFEGELVKKKGELKLLRDVNKLVVDSEAVVSGTGQIGDCHIQGTLLALIAQDNQLCNFRVDQGVLTGDVVIVPQPGDYQVADYLVIGSQNFKAETLKVTAPAQFTGALLVDRDGLKYRVKEFKSLSQLLDQSQKAFSKDDKDQKDSDNDQKDKEDKFHTIRQDNQTIAKNLDFYISPAGSDRDYVVSEFLKLSSNAQGFTEAFQGLQPAYFSALGLVQESNFVLARSSLTNRLQEIMNFTCAKEYVADKRSYLWVDPVGDFTQQNSQNHDMGYHATTIGGFMGYDAYLNSKWRLGVSGGYTNSHVDWMKHVGKGFINSAYVSGYFLYKPGQFYLNGSLCGGYSHYNVTRYIRVGDVKRDARHKNHGFGFEADCELGYISKTKIKIQPYLRQSYVGLYQQKFTETGAASLDLNVDSKKFAMYRLEAGLFFDRCFDYTSWSFLPEINISGIFEQEIKTGNFHARYEETDQAYDVRGMKPTRYLFAPGMSMEALIKKYPLILGLRYHAELGSGFYDQRISGHLGYSF